jgi:hypothetical protein
VKYDRSRWLTFSIEEALARVGLRETLVVVNTGKDFRNRPKVRIETPSGGEMGSAVRFLREDGSYALPPDTRISWSGTAEEALALLAPMPDDAGWEAFHDAFEHGLKISSSYRK